mgnify:CR=1 FL=1
MSAARAFSALSPRQMRLADPRNNEPRATIRDALHGGYHPGCGDCTERAQEVLDALAEAGWTLIEPDAQSPESAGGGVR